MSKNMIGLLLAGGITLCVIYGVVAIFISKSTGFILHGNVDIREVDLAFRQAGRLIHMEYDEGVCVKKGDLLATLDPQIYQDSLAVFQAHSSQAEASLEKIRHGCRIQDIVQAESAVYQSEIVVQEANNHLQRQIDLLTSGATSERMVDAARSLHAVANANLVSTQEILSLCEEGYQVEDVEAAEARVAIARAQVAQAKTALADTYLYAPSDGVISTRVREVGSMVNVGSPVYTLSLQEPIYVRAYISQAQLIHLQPGHSVTVTADGSNQVFYGNVGSISPKAEFTPKAVETSELRTALVYRVRIILPGAATELRQGMPVTVHVD